MGSNSASLENKTLGNSPKRSKTEELRFSDPRNSNRNNIVSEIEGIIIDNVVIIKYKSNNN